MNNNTKYMWVPCWERQQRAPNSEAYAWSWLSCHSHYVPAEQWTGPSGMPAYRCMQIVPVSRYVAACLLTYILETCAPPGTIIHVISYHLWNKTQRSLQNTDVTQVIQFRTWLIYICFTSKASQNGSLSRGARLSAADQGSTPRYGRNL